ncbi:hypothetical protein ACMFMG_011830 [Clarireedia jacksonii]
MMAPELALCRVRLPAYLKSREKSDHNNEDKLRLQWVKSISELFLRDLEPMDRSHIRNWDLVLSLDGSVENIPQNPPTFSVPAKRYPARYRLPEVISDQLILNKDKIRRAELFALGSILYEVIACHQLFYEIYEGVDNEEKIQGLIAKGEFPDDLWGLSITPRILGHWCPRFGFQVLGGVVSAASLATVPLLGAVGFSAVGPVAGSAAAAWQSSIGVVEAGSIFAWCQSAAMGGAALGGIFGAGVGGAGVFAAATAAGALDGADFDILELKERFLVAWNQDMKKG